MIKSILKGSAILIGAYLCLDKYTGLKTALDSGSAAAGTVIKDFQGR